MKIKKKTFLEQWILETIRQFKNTNLKYFESLFDFLYFVFLHCLKIGYPGTYNCLLK